VDVSVTALARHMLVVIGLVALQGDRLIPPGTTNLLAIGLMLQIAEMAIERLSRCRQMMGIEIIFLDSLRRFREIVDLIVTAESPVRYGLMMENIAEL